MNAPAARTHAPAAPPAAPHAPAAPTAAIEKLTEAIEEANEPPKLPAYNPGPFKMRLWKGRQVVLDFAGEDDPAFIASLGRQ